MSQEKGTSIALYDFLSPSQKIDIVAGNGVGITTALNNAVVETRSSGIRTIELGYGNYYYDGMLQPNTDGISIQGNGPIPGYGPISVNTPAHVGTSLIFSTNSPYPAGIDFTDGSGGAYINCSVKNLWLYSANPDCSTGPSCGIRGGKNLLVDGVVAERFYAEGVQLINLTNSAHIKDSTFVANGKGIAAYGGQTTIFSVDNCRVRGNTSGIHLEGGEGVSITNTVLEANLYHALELYLRDGCNNLRNIHLKNCWFESNGYDGGSAYRYPIYTHAETPGQTIKKFTLEECELDNLALAHRFLCSLDDIDYVDFVRCLITSNNGTDSLLLGSRAKFVRAIDSIGASDGLDFTAFPYGWSQAQMANCPGSYIGGSALAQEGVWHPTGNGVTLSELKPCLWRRVGNMMFAYFDIQWPTNTSSAYALFSGFPGTIDGPPSGALPSGVGMLSSSQLSLHDQTVQVYQHPTLGPVGTITFGSAGVNILNSDMSGLRIIGMAIYPIK